MKYQKRNLNRMMPPLTVNGRREVISIACASLGDHHVLSQLSQYGITTIREAKDTVRKLPAKVFRLLFQNATA